MPEPVILAADVFIQAKASFNIIIATDPLEIEVQIVQKKAGNSEITLIKTVEARV